MSLVDYDDDSSSDKENEGVIPSGRRSEEPPVTKSSQELLISGPQLQKRSPVSSTEKHSITAPHNPSTSIKLPDAALLFSSSSSFSNNRADGDDHSLRVSAAMAENASRKRASNGPLPQNLKNKHKKGDSNVKKSELVPPQLLGRSNVVTEDIGKLFVRKRT